MKEESLRHFFLNPNAVEDLKKDLTESWKIENRFSGFKIEDMKENFLVTSKHLIDICDTAIAGKIDVKRTSFS
ncbi:MAG: hypothetical protein SGI74_14300 [Oligoflexia bacterium]|nr:hypothetical protein [Oligoflexia bacterium]